MKYLLKSFTLPLKQISAYLPQRGLIFDLGCGEGVISHYLAQQHPQRQVVGIDLNPRKINQARRHNRLSNLNFQVKDILQVKLTRAAGCVLSDVLHHLPPKDQTALLRQIAHQLPPGSTCIIKEINSENMLRSTLSRLWDQFLYPHDKITYWPAPKLIKTMQDLNFTVTYQPSHLWLPASINLFICRKQ